MLDTRKGEALLAVIDTGSFDAAAALLHLTASAVSQRVSGLESELGLPLLVRAKPCRPTPDGQRLLQYLRRSRLLEDEYTAARDGGPLSVSLAVNNDILTTWLLPGLAQFLIDEAILLDIMLDDQDHTGELLAQGLVLAGVSSSSAPLRGCDVVALGVMRYRMLASPAFAGKWFPGGFKRDAARLAPSMAFNRKDQLQVNFLRKELGLSPGGYPCHYVPTSEAFMQAIALGLGYGMLPEQQYADAVERGYLHDLAPGKWTDVPLYWHSWRVQSPKMERLSKQVIAAARAAFAPAARAIPKR